MKIEKIISFDKTKINLCVWDNVKSPSGIIQIFHGMIEYASRYDKIANFFNKNGFIVYANQLRAHAEDVEVNELGKYNGKNCFWDTVKDQVFISKWLTSKYKLLPLHVFAHSYGSFLAQAYMTMTNLYNKIVLSGSALMKNSLNCFGGHLLSSISCLLHGKNFKPKFLYKMVLGIYHSKLKNQGSVLTTIKDEAIKYHNNPRCGFVCSAKFYKDFFGSFKKIYKKVNSKNIDLNKQILLVSGKNDPISNMGKLVIKLKKYYENLHIKKVTYKLYKNSRHEVFNDVDKDEFLNDVINFYLKKN